MKFLVIIPGYNESEKIQEVVCKVKENTGSNYDILVVDDGSSDNTAELAAKAGAFVLAHAINRGQGAAIKTGIEYALREDYDAVVFFDADGQMQASEIAQITAPLENGSCQVVLGSRFLGKTINMPLSKMITLKLALVFTRLTAGLKLSDTHNGFQAWSREALSRIKLTQDRYAYASQILEEIGKRGLKYQEAPVTISYSDYSRRKGQSIFNAFNIILDLILRK